jgi:septal ring factor EnvC (AmiA/AmiB activator)
MQGQIEFPAQGQRLREYGEADGFGGNSKGLYIATRKLAQVTAPADGEIEFAGEFRSYGQLLILNAGEGYHVLLAGLGRITAEAGQGLRAGEPIGSMGEAPARGTLIGDRLDDPRPILYIEFRKDGSSIDPSEWWVGSRKEASR